jgi:tetratricopeptide (TPR) repeat protein
LNLGIAHQEAGHLEPAIEAYRQALKLAPDSATALWNLALLCERQGQSGEARQLYARFVEKNPDSDEARFRLAYSSFAQGEYQAAAEEFEACLKRRPDWPEPRVNAAIAYWKLGDLDRAWKSFESAAALEPKSVDALRGLAGIAIERNAFQQALEFHGKLIDLGERTPDLLYNTGLLLQKAGQNDNAARLYEEALREKPDFSEALVNLGLALEALGRP